MGLRPIERHPSRIINRGNNSLFFDILEHTKTPVEEADKEPCDCCEAPDPNDWDGVTHLHLLTSEPDVFLQIRTHYNEEQEQYSLLDFIIVSGPGDEPTDLKVIVKRGETSEQIKERMGEQEEPSDEHMATVINLFT